MQTQNSRPLKFNGPCSESDRNPAAASPSLGDNIVLEDAIKHDRFRDGDCAILCSGCGESVERYYEGLPNPFVRFRTDCPDCRVTLHPWSVVVVPGIRKTAPSNEELRDITQSYWERQFRIGVVDDQLPHTREFTDAVQKLADEWGWEWEVACPLCDRPLSELEQKYLSYHHWEYETDIGTSVCIDCHDYLHGDDDNGQANAQDWRAKKLGLADFRDLAVIRLARRDRSVHNPPQEEDSEEYAIRLRRRYNVPVRSTRIRKLVTEVQYQDDVNETLQTHGASPKVKIRGVYPV